MFFHKNIPVFSNSAISIEVLLVVCRKTDRPRSLSQQGLGIFPTSIMRSDLKKLDSKFASWYYDALLAETIAPVRIANSNRNCNTGLIKNFLGGCFRDRNTSSNRRQTLPHLRHRLRRISSASNDGRTGVTAHRQ